MQASTLKLPQERSEIQVYFSPGELNAVVSVWLCIMTALTLHIDCTPLAEKILSSVTFPDYRSIEVCQLDQLLPADHD